MALNLETDSVTLGTATNNTAANGAGPFLLGAAVALQPGTVWKVESIEANITANGGAESAEIEVIIGTVVVAKFICNTNGAFHKESASASGIGLLHRVGANSENAQLRAINKASTTASLPVNGFCSIGRVIDDPAQLTFAPA